MRLTHMDLTHAFFALQRAADNRRAALKTGRAFLAPEDLADAERELAEADARVERFDAVVRGCPATITVDREL